MYFNNFIKDPIYGIISFENDPLFLQLVYSKDFLRLKNIKQLGICELFFSKANHNRFSHSVGVYHLSKIFLNYLDISLESHEAKIVMIAALLHDIGHGPFSHVFEKISHIKHEMITRKIIEEKKTEIHKILLNHNINPKEISNIYINKSKKPWMWQIIKSVIDVDRIDYIVRDSNSIEKKISINIPLLMSRTKINSKGYIIHSYKNKNIIEDILRQRLFMRRNFYENNNVLLYEWVFSNIFIELKKHTKTLSENSQNILHWKLVSFLIKKKINIKNINIKKYLILNDNILLDFLKSVRNLNFNENLNILIDSFFNGEGLIWKDIKFHFEVTKKKNYCSEFVKLKYNLLNLQNLSSFKKRFQEDILFYKNIENNETNFWFSNSLLKKNDNIKALQLINNNFSFCKKGII